MTAPSHPPVSTIRFAIPQRLARSLRPGYTPDDRPMPKCVVDAWLADANAFGIRSIICLLHDERLKLYADLGSDLVAYYRQNGFEVESIPVRDHQIPPLDADELARIAHAYDALPKPVLVHCSAGIDRTGSAIRHFERCVDNDHPSSAMSA
jgi:protein tyrosine phosphatase (PTP) superfamily phosphohydrolase (DUF442 family)